MNSFPGMEAQLLGLRTIWAVELNKHLLCPFVCWADVRVCRHVLCVHLTSDLLRLPGQSQQRQAPWGSPKRKVVGSGRLRSQHALSSFLSHLFICPGLIAGHPFHRLWLGTYYVPDTVLSAENTFDINVWSLTSRRSKAIDVHSKICSVAMKFIPWKGLHSSITISTFCRKISLLSLKN